MQHTPEKSLRSFGLRHLGYRLSEGRLFRKSPEASNSPKMMLQSLCLEKAAPPFEEEQYLSTSKLTYAEVRLANAQ